MWVCDICESVNIQIKDWINVNDPYSDCTSLPDRVGGCSTIEEYNQEYKTYCLECKQLNCGIKWREDD